MCCLGFSTPYMGYSILCGTWVFFVAVVVRAGGSKHRPAVLGSANSHVSRV